MSKLSDKIYLLGTYLVTSLNIALDFETSKSIILFVGAMVLLFLQIRLHVIRIRKESVSNEKKTKK
jgi:hypothetical protein